MKLAEHEYDPFINAIIQVAGSGVAMDRTDFQLIGEHYLPRVRDPLHCAMNCIEAGRFYRRGLHFGEARYGSAKILYDASLPIEQVEFKATTEFLSGRINARGRATFKKAEFQFVVDSGLPTPEEMRIPNLRIGMWVCSLV